MVYDWARAFGPMRRLHIELGPQIDFAGLGIVWKVFTTSGVNHLALMNEVSTIHQLQSLAHVMVGNQDSESPLTQSAHDLLHLINCDRINAAEWLIQEQQLGTGHQ